MRVLCGWGDRGQIFLGIVIFVGGFEKARDCGELVGDLCCGMGDCGTLGGGDCVTVVVSEAMGRPVGSLGGAVQQRGR